MTSELADKKAADASSVGFVQRRYATLFEPPNRLRMECGREFGPITVAYETYGKLSPEKDNAIFICHALTGDAHAAGWHTREDCFTCQAARGEKTQLVYPAGWHTCPDGKPGWWDIFVGPGKGLDTEQYFVICANVLGGCQGTTGPSSIDPETGQPYCLTFPFITVGDLVEVHSALVRHLGIEKLLAVIGGSLGGMQVLEWAARFPDQLRSAIVLASAARLSAQGIAFNAVGRWAIQDDPHFEEGRYYGKEPGPRRGLALARMIAHITYLSEDSIEKKFGRRLQYSDTLAYVLKREAEFQVESYLQYQGTRFVERFDANSYLYLTRAMDYFDLSEAYGSLEHALGRTSARYLIVSYTSDWLFPTAQSKELVRALVRCGRDVTFVEFESPYGHDSFLIKEQMPQLQALVRPFLEQTRLMARGRAD